MQKIQSNEICPFKNQMIFQLIKGTKDGRIKGKNGKRDSFCVCLGWGV